MKKLRKTQAVFNLPTLKLEGGLFLPDQLEKAALGSAKWQTEADYLIPKGLKLKDDYSRAFQIASAQYKHFAAQTDRVDVDAAALTQHLVLELLRDAFGYSNLATVSGITVGERHYPVQLLAGSLPIVVAPHTLGLDDADVRFAIAGSGSRKKSAFQLAQELLNASSDYLWAIVSNGKQLRLLRDAATLTRPSFLEVDLQDLLSGQRYAEFANIWRLLHASRAGSDPQTCIWERWREAGQEEGTRVRDGLRLGVTQALLILGEGFLQHSGNEALRRALHDGELSKDAYFQQLLRLIYRLIFLFSVEERGLLHPADDNKEAIAARRAYAEGYAVARLRELCLKRRARNRFDDHWQSLRIVFKGLSEGEPRLALPALGGLFALSQCPQLDAASLSNTHLLAAMQNLRWASHGGTLAPVDYRNMGPEELGSVYESLLELVPEIDLPAKRFGFVGLTSEGSTAGNARKLTGSYYTPDSLVQELIKSALDPVIEQRLAENPTKPVEALLAIRVIDPACGSGHFLLAAARRLAEKLAQLQTPEGAVKPQDYRHALREVVSRCIFGVDRNPMALELARTALWLEGFEEGRPLGFLDHHLQCGDALLGLTDLKALELGIAKDAFKVISGDDKEVCKTLIKINNTELKQLESQRNHPQFNLPLEQTIALRELEALENLPAETPSDIAAKETAYKTFLKKVKSSHLHSAADMLLGAYLLPKTDVSAAKIPTTGTLYLELVSEHHNREHQQRREAAREACKAARVFHWPLAFPQVYAAGGFDCVLGNPPWEIVQARDGTQDVELLERQKNWFSFGVFSILSGRRDLYKLFLAIVHELLSPSGRCGFILPIGFMFEDDSKELRRNLFEAGSVISVLHLQNAKKSFFPDVHASYRFVAVTLSPEKFDKHSFSVVVKNQADLLDPCWQEVSRKDFDVVLGKNRSAILFSDVEQANLHRLLTDRLRKKTNLDYKIVAEFHASSDKEFLKGSKDVGTDRGLLKNGSIHHFSPSFGPVEKWVSASVLPERLVRKGLLPEIWMKASRLVFRDIARNDDTRTLIPCLVPLGFVSTYDAPMLVPISVDQQSDIAMAFYAGYLSSFVADFIIRPFVDKHIKGYVLARVPIPLFDASDRLMLMAAETALKLAEESWMGNGSKSDHSHPDRVKLDALFLAICGVNPYDFCTLFESFSSIKAEEMRRFGEFRTLRLVQQEFDTLDFGRDGDEVCVLNGEPDQPKPSYSERGVIRDELDARLAGLLLTMIQQLGRLPRRQLSDAPLIAARTELLSVYVGEESAKAVEAYQVRYAGIFEPARLAGDRVQGLVRHFEGVGLVRVESDQFVAVQGKAIPGYLIVDDQATSVASILLKATEQMQLGAGDEEVSVSQESSKQA